MKWGKHCLWRARPSLVCFRSSPAPPELKVSIFWYIIDNSFEYVRDNMFEYIIYNIIEHIWWTYCEWIIYEEPGQLLFAPGHPQRVGLMSVNILNWLFLSRIVFIFLWFRPLYLYLVKLGFVFQTDWDQLSERSDRLGPPAHRKWSNWGSPPLSLMVMMLMMLMMLVIVIAHDGDWWQWWSWWWWW